MDRLGNMQNIHQNLNSTSSASYSSSSRKQILPLKPPKNQYSLQQFHDVKIQGQQAESQPQIAPVTVLALKKKEKLEKNVVTMLEYRQKSMNFGGNGSTSSYGSSSLNSHEFMLNNASYQKKKKKNSSSGYHSDHSISSDSNSNDSVFSNLVYGGYDENGSGSMNGLLIDSSIHHNHHIDMLHSHPIWSPPNINQLITYQ
ncbi:hypothetical protein L3Y34_016511 [Caenorhabditis briggsae]|nr:hypothetical protein L3Y34_016510 [Caenorhabditis briggsae]ULU14043.1 hypothetical protein L3Y34_016511 [Caenorhabditis briggsae]